MKRNRIQRITQKHQPSYAFLHNKVSTIPYTLLLLYSICITFYIYQTFYTNTPHTFAADEAIINFLPSIFLLFLLVIAKKHERIEGVLLIAAAFVFLGVFHVYVSLASFIYLLITGVLFLLVKHNSQRKGKV